MLVKAAGCSSELYEVSKKKNVIWDICKSVENTSIALNLPAQELSVFVIQQFWTALENVPIKET
jgi:hypothetical protein